VQVRVIGAVESAVTVAVKAQVAGELTQVLFKEGQDVRKGQLLFQIDPRPYQQALDQAQAALAKDTALVAQAEANLARDQAQAENAQVQAKRYSDLSKEGVVSKEQNETYQTTLGTQQQGVKADTAALASAHASLNSDRAAIETARLNLSFCSIRSPVDGRTGSLLVQIGNLIKAQADTGLVTINQLAPIYVTFTVPEQQLALVRRFSAGHALAVQASVNGDPEPRTVEGKLSFIDNTVDNTTGTIKLKATFANQDRVLWPGQFVHVTLTLNTLNDAVTVPSEAIQSGQQGQFAYVVKANKTAEMRIVKVGDTVLGDTVILNGITAGETVVTDGQLRLIPGAPVKIAASPKA
jgi:multidrug efflux system membrane fusion protein